MSRTPAELEDGCLQKEHTKQFEPDKTGSVISDFATEDRRMLWYSRSQKISHSTETGNLYKLEIDGTKGALVSSTLLQKLPPVKVKAEHVGQVEICYTHNLGHNLYSKFTFEVGTFVSSLDNVWLDHHLQWCAYHHPEKLYQYNRSIGNVDSLTEWNSSLPAADLQVLIPFFYSDNLGMAFPFHLLNSDIKAEHILTPRSRNVSLVLRMRVKKGENWTTLSPPDPSFLEGGFPAIPKPEILNDYTEFNSEYSPCLALDEKEDNGTITLYSTYYREVYNPDPQEHTKKVDIGETCTSSCDSSSPTLAVFWSFVDLDYLQSNNLSNYTVSETVGSGTSPASSFSLIYKDIPKVQDMPAVTFSKAEASKCIFPSAPYEEGYHVYSHSFVPFSEYSEVGVPHGSVGAVLSCTLRSDIPKQEKRRFAMLVRHLRLRKFLIVAESGERTGKVRIVM